jgi:hypothetical protein
MRVIQDPTRHDRLERWLALEIVGLVKSKLESAGVSADVASRLTKDISVGVADLWDGCHGLTIEGELLTPFLVFASDNDEEDILVGSYSHTGSFLHEHVASAATNGLGE